MATLPEPTNVSASATGTNSIEVTWQYDPGWFGFDGNDGDILGFAEGIWRSSDNGLYVEYRKEGTSSWNLFSDISSDSTTEELTSLSEDTTYEFRIRSYNGDQTSSSSTTTGTTYLDASRSISSYAAISGGSSETVIDLLIGVESFGTASSSEASRGGISYEDRNSDSWSLLFDSSATRVIELKEKVQSHAKEMRSFTYNDRTSLELIDYTITWNDQKSVWYTNWFQETKITGTEDTLAVRSLTVDNAKDPTAIVRLQYDSTGNGKVDKESKKVELKKNQDVYEFSDVPVDDTGYYRLKIMEYSGYNSIYTIDTAIIH